MNLNKTIRRFFIPGPVVTLYYFVKFRCMISPRAEVEISPLLRVGRKSEIGSFTKIKASDGPLTIGSYVSISTGCSITSNSGGILIGDDTLIGPNASIIGSNYRYSELETPFREQGYTSKGVKIGKNVWIGSGAVILDGALIEDGVIIMPNAVVSSKVRANSMVQGNPGKVIFVRR